MKTHKWLALAIAVGLLACKNQPRDSVERADSANEAKLDSAAGSASIKADEESASFLVKATNIGLAEVQLGELAQQKAMNQQVKDFGAMMVNDHNNANSEVKSLASERNVSLPDSISNEMRRDKDDLIKKSGVGFDKAFMREIIDDHNETIDLFEKASGNVKDNAVKTFVDNRLPTLRNQLDSAKAIQKSLK